VVGGFLGGDPQPVEVIRRRQPLEAPDGVERQVDRVACWGLRDEPGRHNCSVHR